ncbi:unknown [Haloarcula marismortui ATCC 43049]|uniref:Uncharacterized protein n=1 Tax=Haloarcula marismortui (strain ATCC 43049 / DSM 3752 / JCM 8966 / VKM B-1809) TaxID=272569 RepID=Q5V4E5_HALMA|nr:hypothetical protein [Haloarcula marismortui]AAV45607.1 unknown [Haloarcula marismortui ATCC 43049]QCP90393.1 hypothetical protein E6P14_05790 [Haloarcula marismortui ATCC 43049]
MTLTTISDTGIPVKAGISSIGPEPSGPDGSWHSFRDQIPIGVSSREWTGNGYQYSSRAGQRLPVEIGGVPTRMVDVPGAEDFGGFQLVDIPLTLGSGQHAITVDGTTVSTVQIYNPDDPPKPDTDSQPDPEVPGTTGTDEQPGTQPSAGGSESNQQRSTVPTKTVAAAGIAALALLIWAR